MVLPVQLELPPGPLGPPRELLPLQESKPLVCQLSLLLLLPLALPRQLRLRPSQLLPPGPLRPLRLRPPHPNLPLPELLHPLRLHPNLPPLHQRPRPLHQHLQSNP